MSENKNDMIEVTEKAVKTLKPKKIKNQLLFKRGGFSLAITALFIAAVIVANVLVSALADRFHLEYDMSVDKVNTMNKDNLKFIKEIDQEIEIIVSAAEENYATMMANYMQSSFGVSGDYTSYYNQTMSLVKKYSDYNKKITVEFIDMYEDSGYDEIYQKYSGEGLTYGDIIVRTNVEVDGQKQERYKIVTFEDLYNIVEDSSGSYYYYGSSSVITGNNVETAVTSAIAYVLGTDTKKVLILSGHSNTAAATHIAQYKKLLEDNAFEVEENQELMLKEIEDDTDIIVLIAPVADLVDKEVDLISSFLYNDGNYGKGLVYFGTSTYSKLSNLEALLMDWNIQLNEGKLFQTDPNYVISEDPTSIRTMLRSSLMFATSSNQPILAEKSESESLKVESFSAPTTVIAPLSADASWNGYTKDDVSEYSLATVVKKSDYTTDGEEVHSTVVAFASLDFIYSQYAEQQWVANKNLTLMLSQEAVQADDTGISFVSKSITDESFSAKVTEKGSSTVRTIFMIILPLILLAVAVFVYIRRRSA